MKILDIKTQRIVCSIIWSLFGICLIIGGSFVINYSSYDHDNKCSVYNCTYANNSYQCFQYDNPAAIINFNHTQDKIINIIINDYRCHCKMDTINIKCTKASRIELLIQGIIVIILGILIIIPISIIIYLEQINKNKL